ncbi:hypothetical protein [Chondromyces crocatus]|uniref:Secreted protein n=1 Tax=Chondromyces crocatus TaxID=52 RepID=A0A0K1ECG6_CHOCO|nr:hypothetical protein [Chondromyces crocatus]AKT38556.1 uncharacterized protein CMC5_027030 [Chondromyces crocatus]
MRSPCMLRVGLLGCALFLAGCPFPCPSDTRTTGGGQCLPITPTPPPYFGLEIDNATSESVEVRARVSQRELNCSAIDASNAPWVVAAALAGGDLQSIPERYRQTPHTLPPQGRHTVYLIGTCAAVRLWVGRGDALDVVAHEGARYRIARGEAAGSYVLAGERGDESVTPAAPAPCEQEEDIKLIQLSEMVAQTSQQFELGDAMPPPCLRGELLVEGHALRLREGAADARAIAPGAVFPTTDDRVTPPLQHTVFGGMRVLVGLPRFGGLATAAMEKSAPWRSDFVVARTSQGQSLPAIAR